MNLPNGDKAQIPADKLDGYVLNEHHPEQPGHATLFRLLLGIGPHNSQVLRDALLHAAIHEPAILGKPSSHGTKYEVRFNMTGSRGSYNVLSVRIVDKGRNFPRLVTAFIERP